SWAVSGSDEGGAMGGGLRWGLLYADLDAAARCFGEAFAEQRQAILAAADLICRHQFDLLGSGPMLLDGFKPSWGRLGSPGALPWHCDFKSGYGFDHSINHAERRAVLPPGVCKKTPWELSRFYHGPLLGAAYRLSGCERYAAELAWQLTDWLEAVRYPLGAAWGCAMDVGIRAAAWLVSLEFVAGWAGLSGRLYERIEQSLREHGRMIMGHLERWPWVIDGVERIYTTNHYLGDLFGLLFLGHYLPESEEVGRWRRFAAEELESEIIKQVYADGMNVEASTGYQRLDMEMLFFAALLGERRGQPFSEGYRRRLREMFVFEQVTLPAGGRFIAIGDHDSGMALRLGERPIRDHGYLLSYGFGMFREAIFCRPDIGFAPEAIWLFGPEVVDAWRAVEPVAPPRLWHFREAGVVAFREGRDLLLITAGPNGQMGVGGHAHNDKLAVVVVLEGREVVADPGTYLYVEDQQWRNRCRETLWHATLMVDGQQQCRMDPEAAWQMEDTARASVEQVGQRGDELYFVGRHEGYLRLGHPVRHWRGVRVRTAEGRFGSVVIEDRLEPGDGRAWEHELVWSFPLGPGLHVRPGGGGAVVRDEQGELLRIGWDGAVAASDEDGWYAPEYGRCVPARVLRLRGRMRLDRPMRIVLERVC
ncbi:MAG: alginate lyase family protein, partial [Phycisphaerae bacterium]